MIANLKAYSVYILYRHRITKQNSRQNLYNLNGMLHNVTGHKPIMYTGVLAFCGYTLSLYKTVYD